MQLGSIQRLLDQCLCSVVAMLFLLVKHRGCHHAATSGRHQPEPERVSYPFGRAACNPSSLVLCGSKFTIRLPQGVTSTCQSKPCVSVAQQPVKILPGGLQELIHHAAVSGSYQRLSERFSEERLSGAWVFICGYLVQHLQGGRLSISTASPAHVVSLAHLEVLHIIHDWTVQGESHGWAGWLQNHFESLCCIHLCGPVALQLPHAQGQGRVTASAHNMLWEMACCALSA